MAKKPAPKSTPAQSANRAPKVTPADLAVADIGGGTPRKADPVP